MVGLRLRQREPHLHRRLAQLRIDEADQFRSRRHFLPGPGEDVLHHAAYPGGDPALRSGCQGADALHLDGQRAASDLRGRDLREVQPVGAAQPVAVQDDERDDGQRRQRHPGNAANQRAGVGLAGPVHAVVVGRHGLTMPHLTSRRPIRLCWIGLARKLGETRRN